MRKVLITVAVFLASLTTSFANTPPTWDGVLLVNKDDGKYTIFIDRTLDLELMEIVAKVNGELYKHDVGNSGRIYVIEDDGSGWIKVKQEDQSISSVSLAHFINTPLDLIYGRLAAMESKDRDMYANKNSSKTERIENTEPESHLNYPSSNLSENYYNTSDNTEEVFAQTVNTMSSASSMLKDNLSEEGLAPSSGMLSELQEGQYSDMIGLQKEGSSLLNMPNIDAEIKEVEIMKANKAFQTDVQTEYHEYMVDYDPLDYNLKSGDKAPEDVKLTALHMNNHYTLVEDYGEWLIVESKKTQRKYAFNGYHIFKFDPSDFDITYNHEEEIHRFMEANGINFRPINRRNLGVFVGNKQIAKMKHKTPYKVSIDGNTMTINGKKDNLVNFVQDGKHCVVKIEDKETKVLLNSSDTNLNEKKSYYRHYFGAK